MIDQKSLIHIILSISTFYSLLVTTTKPSKFLVILMTVFGTNPTLSHEYETNFAVSCWALGMLLPHIFLQIILAVLGGLGVVGWLFLIVGCIWRLCRQFWWFQGMKGVVRQLCLIVGRMQPLCRQFWWFQGVQGVVEQSSLIIGCIWPLCRRFWLLGGLLGGYA